VTTVFTSELREKDAEIARLKEINDELWRHLTPDQRHLLNLKWKALETK
jgi:hypothetical protein